MHNFSFSNFRFQFIIQINLSFLFILPFLLLSASTLLSFFLFLSFSPLSFLPALSHMEIDMPSFLPWPSLEIPSFWPWRIQGRRRGGGPMPSPLSHLPCLSPHFLCMHACIPLLFAFLASFARQIPPSFPSFLSFSSPPMEAGRPDHGSISPPTWIRWRWRGKQWQSPPDPHPLNSVHSPPSLHPFWSGRWKVGGRSMDRQDQELQLTLIPSFS